MPNNYNGIARFYDFLSRLIFQRTIVEAQVGLLKQIPANSSVLIVGGGTGWVLEELAKIHSKGIEITYVEKSGEMIKLAKKKNYKKNKVEFIHQGIEEYIADKKFDVILTAFLFDNFLIDKIEFVFSKLDALLKQRGFWLFADFRNDDRRGPFWQKLLLKTMYLFFKITCNIETPHLVNMDSFFTGEYNKIFEAFYFSRFIKASIYSKKLQ
jgi:ubiquinone/menaquinone biosynthesis C-methylase UbiE